MDSSESPTGEQEGSAYNGHFGCTCYPPVFVFNQFGDVERRASGPGNVHSAADWRAVLESVTAHYRGVVKRLHFRGDATFANPEMYGFIETEGAGYDPTAGQQHPAEQDRLSAEAPGRATAARCAATTPASPIKRKAGASRAAHYQG